MFAVTMMMRNARIVAAVLPLLVGACGGAQGFNSGYPSGEKEPWTSPDKLTINANGEASGEGTIAFPQDKRAKWYSVELPVQGDLQAKLTFDAQNTGADVGFEILDSGFNVVAAPQSDDDIGQAKKVRTVKDARAGRTYIHIYALGRADILEYKLRLKYDPKAGAPPPPPQPQVENPGVVFPATVPNLPPLAAIPGAPPPKKGEPVVVKPPEPTPTPQVPTPPTPPPIEGKVGEITEFGTSGSGVRIVINKGAEAGVEEGWEGNVLEAASGNKKLLPKGSFKVKKVKDDESEGIVNLTLDDIQRNRKVVLKKP
jgi:hypothetical protein